MEAEVVAIELKPSLGNGRVTLASALAFPVAASPLLVTSCPVPVNHGVAVALRGRVLEAQVVAHATVEAATEAFSSLASRGWRCGSSGPLLEPSMSCRLQLFLLRPKDGSPDEVPSASPLHVSFAAPSAAWVGRAVAMHGAPFGARVDAPGGSTWARFQRVVMQGVVSNVSSPTGLLMTDVHMADSFAGAALVLQDTNQVIALMAPSLRSSSGESVALSLAIPMAMILDTLLDNDACREQLLPAELAALPPPCDCKEAALLPSEVRQGVALLWLESGSWASAIVLSEAGHLLTCAHLLTSVSWMEGQQLPARPTARQCKGRCYVSREGEVVSMTFEADVLQIFEGCLDAALLLVRHDQPASFNPSLWRRQATVAELVQGLEVSAVGYGLFGPGCPWEGPAVTTGQLCKVAHSQGPQGRRAAVLQSSAAVHRGCSGGALVAKRGELLGMVTTNVKQQDGSVMPHVNFILPVTLLTPICTYLDNLKVLPAEHALKKLTEELRFSSANDEEQGLWRLETETLELPSRMLARKRHALKRMDELQREAEEEVERREQMAHGAARSKL